MNSIYVIGSLRNPLVPEVAAAIEYEVGIEAYVDWYSAGPSADDCWQEHQEFMGRSYAEALKGYAARTVYNFDKTHLDRCDAAVLVMPGGKSAHLELGYMAGKGKPTYVLFDMVPERWDVMYQFADAVFFNKAKFIEHLKVLEVGRVRG